MLNDKEFARINQLLFSKHESSVRSALAEVKDHGDARLFASVIELFGTVGEGFVKSDIREILQSVKSPAAVPVFINALQNKAYVSIRKELLTACWMSGLEFENSLSVFVDLFIEGDLVTAFESFTVIENNVIFGDFETIEIQTEKLKNSLQTSEEKRQLTLDLIQILSLSE